MCFVNDPLSCHEEKKPFFYSTHQIVHWQNWGIRFVFIQHRRKKIMSNGSKMDVWLLRTIYTTLSGTTQQTIMIMVFDSLKVTFSFFFHLDLLSFCWNVRKFIVIFIISRISLAWRNCLIQAADESLVSLCQMSSSSISCFVN